MRLIDADAFIKYTKEPSIYDMTDVKEMIEDQPTVDGWISVEEDIPMIGVHVILANGVEVLTGYLDCKMVWRRDNDYAELKNVTDWQPLPKLPKGVS